MVAPAFLGVRMADGDALVSIRERLLKERHALLDLSTRNRLLNTPLRTRNNRAIEIVDERSLEVFRLLSAGKGLTFVPGVALTDEERAELDPDDVETGGIPQPDDQQVDERGVAARHADTRLQTRLTSVGLQKRLLDIWYDARTLEEEQGVNILYLAVGLLRWFDTETSDVARHAPLVLLPVSLERNSAADKFSLKTRGEPPSPNLTLQAKMKAEYAVTIEDFADEDDLDLQAYFGRVAETVKNQARWEVLPDAMVLGFFSFSKFLMYRDLDPDNWPSANGIDAHPLITALLRDGFPESEPLVAEHDRIDDLIAPIELHHVVDADSSQTVAIAEAAAGRTLVVKGPPGTGKSQTITNIIAAAAAKGRKVLFVAEKMAALEVVHRRLQQSGLGPLALELHSNKVTKRAVLEELRRTRDAQIRTMRGDTAVIDRLAEATQALNVFADRLHEPLRPCGLSPHQIVGRLVKAHDDQAPSGFRLDTASDWMPAEFDRRRKLAQELAERAAVLGPLPEHLWRGVCREPLDPAELEELAAALRRMAALLDRARDAAGASLALGASAPTRVAELGLALQWLQAAASAPAAGREVVAHPGWRRGAEAAKRLAAAGRAWVESRRELEGVLNAPGWNASFDAIRAAVVTKGRSPFRFLDGGYRAQVALLQSFLTIPLPKSHGERLKLIDAVMAAQAHKAGFAAAQADAELFGDLWQGEDSRWDDLQALVAWREANGALPAEAWARLAAADLAAAAAACDVLRAARDDLGRELARLADTLKLDLRRAFGVEAWDGVLLDALGVRLRGWRDDLESVTRFIAFAVRARELSTLGGGALVAGLEDGALGATTFVPAFERAYAEALRGVLFQAWPELKGFDGEVQDRLVAEFRALDRSRIELAKEQIVRRHAEERPKGAAGIGPLGVLNAELAKRRAHLPIRVLLDRAGPAIQNLKPVFMMSPLSIAQFLKPGGLKFDLLVMDEASQIEPVDALGAVARAAQIVVVGDERQLPPTSFFKKLTGEEDAEGGDDGVTIQAKDAESILDLCLAKGAPHRMLSWHYRSKHQSLIAVSNREFYENKLFIVPSPYDAVAGMGLKFHLLSDAPYDRGASRTNPREARIVAEAVMRHARETPEQSLGVATFSVAQRQAIMKELELLRRANPDLEEYFGRGSAEPFFVKNLENIQGDERDVIFISVGYGKTEQGYLAHNFGPLSGEGGERRLNVLISRAKLRCEVFANFTGADIDLERTRARGVAGLKLFLTFAETGNFGLGEAAGGDHDSDFEAQVCQRLRALGYDVKAQIGASGFRVDLAVADPQKPGRFVLGVECDGAQYHSSRSARDRDRLRQQVLEAHGWIIHRIWSTDWYLRPKEELAKLEAAIAAATAEWRDRDEHGVSSRQAVPLSFEVEALDDHDVVTAVVEGAASSSGRAPYREASFQVNTACEPHAAPLADMTAYVFKIVEEEGPIHIDEIATRVRELWGLQRAGARIRAAVARAADLAAGRGLITEGPFHAIPARDVVVRNRANVSSATLRKPEMLPPSEIDAAILAVVGENFGASRDELVQAVSRDFGFSATSAQLRSVLEGRVDHLVAGGALTLNGQLLVRAPQPA